MKSWLVVILGLWGSWHFTDLHSDETFHSVIAPLGVMLFAIAFVIRLVFALGPKSGRDGGGFDGGGGFFGGSDSGGDGGCGGDGGSC